MFDKIKLSYRMTKYTVDRMLSDDKAESPVKALFMIFIIAVLAGALLPTGVASLKAANTTTWTASEVATYGIITIMILIAVVMLIAKIATD